MMMFTFLLSISLQATWADSSQALVDLPGHVNRTAARVYLPNPRSDSALKSQWPVIVLLHGYKASGFIQEAYFNLSKFVGTKGFILLIPNGLKNREGNRFWNATETCCDFGGQKPNDSGYLMELVDYVVQTHGADPSRVSVIGHSNGAFMANRLACDHGSRIRSIVSIAGSSFINPLLCKNLDPVGFLGVHGTDDTKVPYEGNFELNLSAPALNEVFARRNGCRSVEGSLKTSYNHSYQTYGNETDLFEWGGCSAPVQHLRMNGIGHVPLVYDSAVEYWLDFLLK
jgi:polyhydroxybutyrate depolymerase